jgi:hypothetical protein
MLVEAIYDNGRLLFSQQYHFAHDHFSIKVEVPDAEIVDKNVVATKPEQAVHSGSSMAVSGEYPAEYVEFQQLRNAIFGKDYVYVQEKTDRDRMQTQAGFWKEIG